MEGNRGDNRGVFGRRRNGGFRRGFGRRRRAGSRYGFGEPRNLYSRTQSTYSDRTNSAPISDRIVVVQDLCRTLRGDHIEKLFVSFTDEARTEVKNFLHVNKLRHGDLFLLTRDKFRSMEMSEETTGQLTAQLRIMESLDNPGRLSGNIDLQLERWIRYFALVEDTLRLSKAINQPGNIVQELEGIIGLVEEAEQVAEAALKSCIGCQRVTKQVPTISVIGTDEEENEEVSDPLKRGVAFVAAGIIAWCGIKIVSRLLIR